MEKTPIPRNYRTKKNFFLEWGRNSTCDLCYTKKTCSGPGGICKHQHLQYKRGHLHEPWFQQKKTCSFQEIIGPRLTFSWSEEPNPGIQEIKKPRNYRIACSWEVCPGPSVCSVSFGTSCSPLLWVRWRGRRGEFDGCKTLRDLCGEFGRAFGYEIVLVS